MQGIAPVKDAEIAFRKYIYVYILARCIHAVTQTTLEAPAPETKTAMSDTAEQLEEYLASLEGQDLDSDALAQRLMGSEHLFRREATVAFSKERFQPKDSEAKVTVEVLDEKNLNVDQPPKVVFTGKSTDSFGAFRSDGTLYTSDVAESDMDGSGKQEDVPRAPRPWEFYASNKDWRNRLIIVFIPKDDVDIPGREQRRKPYAMVYIGTPPPVKEHGTGTFGPDRYDDGGMGGGRRNL